MFLPSLKDAQLTPEQAHLLRDTTIDARSPGPILHDFDALLTYCKENKLTLTAGHQLPLRALPEINARLAHPVELGLKRPQQKAYPHIHGLYLALRASGLTRVDDSGKNPVLIVDETVYQTWSKLNPTEQYGTLLEAWLLLGRSEILGERGRFLLDLLADNFQPLTGFFRKIPGNGLPVAGDKRAADSLKYWPGVSGLGLADLFGLVRIERCPPEPGQGWCIDRIHRTPFGDALLTALYVGFFAELGNILALDDAQKLPFGALRSVLQPYFPEWKNTLSLPDWNFREGMHIFKVALGPVWSRIAVGAKQPLDTLALAILDAVDFDDDHLYRFTYRTQFGFDLHINHPYLEEGAFTSEVRVGDVPLRVGQTMIYLFDFGDHWLFDVTLEKVDPAMAVAPSRILEKHGDPPEQYPGWGDDDDDDEDGDYFEDEYLMLYLPDDEEEDDDDNEDDGE